MSSQCVFILIALAISGVIMAWVIYQSGHPAKAFFLSAGSGLGSLFAVNLLGALSGISFGINYITLLISLLGGIPGVIGLLVTRALILA